MSEQLSSLPQDTNTMSKEPSNLPCQDFDLTSEQLSVPKLQAAESMEDATADTFTLFPKLPLELRRKVFTYTENFEQPARWLNVVPYECDFGDTSDRSPPLTVLLNTMLDPKLTTPLTTMAICKEARQEALRVNVSWRGAVLYLDFDLARIRDIFMMYPLTERVYVNPTKDIFFFRSCMKNFCDYQLDNAAANMATAEHAIAAFGRVQHLSFSFRLFFTSSPGEVKAFLAYLSNFSMLKDLTILVPDDPHHLTAPICSCASIENLQATFSLRMTAFFQEFIQCVFRYVGDKNFKFKLPLKVLYYSDHMSLLRIYDEFKPKEAWEKEWDKILKENWTHFFRVFRDAEKKGFARAQLLEILREDSGET